MRSEEKNRKIVIISAIIVLLIVLDVFLYIKSNNLPIIEKINEALKLPHAGGTYQENEISKTSSNEENGIMPIKVTNIDQFNWVRDEDTSIGRITTDSTGKEVSMVGNRTLQGKNCIYIMPEAHQYQEFAFDYTIDYGDSFISAGVLIKIKKDTASNSLIGYMVSFNNQNQGWYGEAGSKLGGLWKVTFPLGQNSDNTVTKQLVQGLDLPVSGHMKITADESTIKIEGSGIDGVLTENATGDFGDGFGFFTAHYSHNCERIGSFALRNFATMVIDILPHKLKVNPNGGTWKGSSDISEEEGVWKDVRDIPLPLREGYTFVKWEKTGNGGQMSTLTDSATYTFGEDETDDTITAQWVKTEISKQSDISSGKVTKGQKITYALTVQNEGTVASTAVIKDQTPQGTTFVEGSIKIDGQPALKDGSTPYTQSDLESGITVTVNPNVPINLTFEVIVQDLEDKVTISNTAHLKDTTVASRTYDKNSNQVDLEYVEPIISQTKDKQTENGNDYVINNERITYKINVANEGGLAKKVVIADEIPEGTTFIEGSIKLNGELLAKENSSDDEDETFDSNLYYTQEDLENGIVINIPEYTDKNELSFDVTVNDLEDSTFITNTATVDETETNSVKIEYREPIISEQKAAITEHEQEFVVSKERVTYTIKVENYGKLEKNCIIKDRIPKGTTFIEKSIKIDDKPFEEYDEKDLKNGIEVLVPRRYVAELDENKDDNKEIENGDDQEGTQNGSSQDNVENNDSQEDTENGSSSDSQERQAEENIDALSEETLDENDEEDPKIDTKPGVTTLSFEVEVNTLKSDDKIVTITNVATVDDEETNEVELEARPFNFKIEIEIENINLNANLYGATNKKLAKVEVPRKEVQTSSVVAKYKVIVTNVGKIAGIANVEDTIPQGFSIDTTNPTYWKQTSSNKMTMTTEEIKPGKSKELEINLAWENGNSNFGEYENAVEITSTKNVSDAEETTTKDNKDDAEVMVSIGTGLNKKYKQILIISFSSMTILGLGIQSIRKFVLL